MESNLSQTVKHCFIPKPILRFWGHIFDERLRLRVIHPRKGYTSRLSNDRPPLYQNTVSVTGNLISGCGREASCGLLKMTSDVHSCRNSPHLRVDPISKVFFFKNKSATPSSYPIAAIVVSLPFAKLLCYKLLIRA